MHSKNRGSLYCDNSSILIHSFCIWYELAVPVMSPYCTALGSKVLSVTPMLIWTSQNSSTASASVIAWWQVLHCLSRLNLSAHLPTCLDNLLSRQVTWVLAVLTLRTWTTSIIPEYMEHFSAYTNLGNMCVTNRYLDAIIPHTWAVVTSNMGLAWVCPNNVDRHSY